MTLTEGSKLGAMSPKESTSNKRPISPPPRGVKTISRPSWDEYFIKGDRSEMGHKHNELRMKYYKFGDMTIQVNTKYRNGVGYRAIIRNQQGKFGDSTNSPEEAIGRLIITWVLEEGK